MNILEADSGGVTTCGFNKERKMLLNFRKDPKQYDLIYAEFAPMVFKFLFKRTGDPQEAEDLTQETFFHAFTSLVKFEWRGISLRVYLIQIARNVFNSWYQKNKSNGGYAKIISEQIAVSTEAADADLLLAEDSEILNSCLQDLTENQRDTIELFYWYRLRTREIAVIMGTRESTVKSQLQRGRMAVKAQLREMGLDYASFNIFSEAEEIPAAKVSIWSFIKKPRRGFSQ